LPNFATMRKVAFTGSYYSGLDKVREVAGYHGIPVFDADLAVKFMLNWREDILRQIRIQFGHESAPDGNLQPGRFSSPAMFDRLLDLVDVDLFLAWESFCGRHAGCQMAIFKSHILFERSWESRFDAVVNVFRPQDLRITDIYRTRHVSRAHAAALLAQEMDEGKKSRASDYVIHNYDSLSMMAQFESVRSQLVCPHLFGGYAKSPRGGKSLLALPI